MPAVIENNAHKVHIFNNLCPRNFSYIYIQSTWGKYSVATEAGVELSCWKTWIHSIRLKPYASLSICGLFSKQKEPWGLQKYNHWIYGQFIERKTVSQGTYTIHVNVLWHTCIPCMHLILQILQPFYISWDFCFQLMTIHLFVFLFIDWFYTSLEKQTCISDFFSFTIQLFIYLFTYWLIDWLIDWFVCLFIVYV